VKRLLVAFVLSVCISACGGNNTTTSPTPTPTPPATTFSLSGQVTDSTTSTGISGASVSVADGPNASKSTTTDVSGNYSFTGLQPSGFTVNVSASNYTSASKAVTLTSNQTLSFVLTRLAVTPPPTPPASCVYTLSIGSTIEGYPNGGTFPVAVTTADGCSWAATANVPWIHFQSPGSGTGSSRLTFTVDANSSTSARTGTLIIAGQTITFNQTAPPPAAPACTAAPSINPWPAGDFFLGWATSTGAVDFTWSGTVTGGVTSYVLELGRTVGGTDVGVRDVGNVTLYYWTGLQKGVSYHARVRAKNTCGTSGPSNEQTFTVQ